MSTEIHYYQCPNCGKRMPVVSYEGLRGHYDLLCLGAYYTCQEPLENYQYVQQVVDDEQRTG